MPSIDLVGDGDLVRTDWGNSVATELNTHTVKRAGATMTGNLVMSTGSKVQQAAAPTGVNDLVNKTYVDTNFVSDAGDTMNGTLTIVPAATHQCLALRTAVGGTSANLPYLAFYNSSGSVRYGFFQGSSAELRLTSDNAIAFGTDGVYYFRMTGDHFLVGMTAPSAYADGGVDMAVDGEIYSTTGIAGQRNLNCGHIGGADANGQHFIRFSRSTAGTGIGAIHQVGTTGTNYAESSDRRMKQILGPVPDAVERVKALRPYRVSWIGDDERPDSDAFIADEVDELLPGAVQGEVNAVGDDGMPEYQMLDYSKTVPLLTAALQEALSQVEALTARVAALEAA